ncbi:hypothetical protein FUA23_10300 [Neolewinella aurantiaca]|uniref:Colicin D immunity protein domain-containing protein n=1 Tax=Neolewinella aurantiaca TaxID=2602767 RepID=A0A5C7FEM6_9BACT|nr:colicin immunity domain-containing protein [Neolewinella aurantiaca]TXF89582.1 hypothetical protein FUA23_10300 [Neolewinella aurantiaca]
MNAYLQLFRRLNGKQIPIGEFEKGFAEKWRRDRDEKTSYDPRFHRLIDRVFTSLDVCDDPEIDPAFDEDRLREEVALLTHVWFGE